MTAWWMSSRVLVRFSRRRPRVVRRGMVVLARRQASWFHPGAEAESSLRCHRRGRPRAIETLGRPGRVWEGTQIAVQYDNRPIVLYDRVQVC